MKHLASIRILAVIIWLTPLLIPSQAQTDGMCFLTVLRLRDSGYSEEQNLVINDAGEWQSVWDKIYSNTSEKPPLPQIDFTRRTILAVLQGDRPSGGYEISIEGIAETGAILDVMVKAFAPGRGCVTEGKVTRPLHIIEIEKTAKVAVFHVKHKVRNCQ